MKAAELADADPAGLVGRLEHRVQRLEHRKASTLADIDRAHREIDHATTALASPFPLATELTTARTRVRQIEEQLAQLADHQSDMRNATPTPTPSTITSDKQARHEADFEAGR